MVPQAASIIDAMTPWQVLDRRRALARLAAPVLALAVAGCEDPQPPLRVGTIVFPGYEFLFLAREKGWLDPRQVRLIELLSSTDNLALMEEGRLDAATLTIDEVIATRSKGVDLRIVAVLDISDGADAVMARAGLDRPPLLRRRRVGVEDRAMGVVMLDAVLQAAGLRVEDIVKIPMTVDQTVTMFQAEQLDAVVTFEPWVGRLEALGAVRLFDSTRIPDRIVDVLAVRAEVLQKRPAEVRHLVAAHFTAQDHFRRDGPGAGALLAPRLQVAPDDVAASFRGLRLPDVVANREVLRAGGRFDEAVQAIQRVLVERRILPRAVPIDGLVDTRFLPAA
jgi:NitT/TauT family transport system substrate-binding protein